jgi:Domain of unknown function (DUF1906)
VQKCRCPGENINVKPCTIFSSALLAAAAISLAFFAHAQPAQPVSPQPTAYLGFDRDIYPGDAAFATLQKNFAFTGYWLGPPPGERTNTWLAHRDFLRKSGFGFLVLFNGRDGNEFKNAQDAAAKAANDARSAAAAAKREGFPAGTIIFLDIEEGGRLSAAYHAYLRVWFDDLARSGNRAGVYCSGMPAKESGGVTILTADDIRANAAGRDFAFFVYNDACPPSPGCTFPAEAPAPSASGVAAAQAWQFAQSPRRRQFSAHCPPGYHRNGNCYSPADTSFSWELDVDTATSADPSNGTRP